MCARFTGEDEGKDVINSDGEKIGVVVDVRNGTPHVDPDPRLTDELKSKLGWGAADEETYQLDVDNVESITDDAVRLGRL